MHRHHARKSRLAYNLGTLCRKGQPSQIVSTFYNLARNHLMNSASCCASQLHMPKLSRLGISTYNHRASIFFLHSRLVRDPLSLPPLPPGLPS